MVKINIEHICDDCGKSKKKTITIRGYEEVVSIMENRESGYIPDAWSHEETINKLRCPKCTKKRLPKYAVWVG